MVSYKHHRPSSIGRTRSHWSHYWGHQFCFVATAPWAHTRQQTLSYYRAWVSATSPASAARALPPARHLLSELWADPASAARAVPRGHPPGICLPGALPPAWHLLPGPCVPGIFCQGQAIPASAAWASSYGVPLPCHASFSVSVAFLSFSCQAPDLLRAAVIMKIESQGVSPVDTCLGFASFVNDVAIRSGTCDLF